MARSPAIGVINRMMVGGHLNAFACPHDLLAARHPVNKNTRAPHSPPMASLNPVGALVEQVQNERDTCSTSASLQRAKAVISSLLKL
jgi:hypothetical protein